MLNRVKSVMLMTLLGLILVSAGGYVGGQNGATMMFIIALILNFYSYWNSDKIVLKAYNAKELSENQVPELFSLVKGLSRMRESLCRDCILFPQKFRMLLLPAGMKIMPLWL